MPNSIKFIFAALLLAVATQVGAETTVISEQEFNNTLQSAQDAYVAKDYTTAVGEFSQLAKWGDKHSQFIPVSYTHLTLPTIA